MALLHLLLEISEELALGVTAVHVHHGIRGSEADGDEAFVREYCAARGVPLRVFREDVPTEAAAAGETEEEAGRRLRYRDFDRPAEELVHAGVPKEHIRIAVAHHADDQVETVLLRILRGTGPDGLAGMAEARTDEAGFLIIRPLLGVRKADLAAYCREEGIPVRQDSTNEEAAYRRNRIRLELLPELETYNPNVREALLRLSRIAADDRDHFVDAAAHALSGLTKKQGGGSILLDGPGLRALDKSVRVRTLLLAAKEAGLSQDMTFALAERCDAVLNAKGPSPEIDLPHGFLLTKAYGDVLISAPRGERPLPRLRTSVFPAGEFREKMAELQPEKGTWAAFDGEDAARLYGSRPEDRITIRTRRQGDTIAIPGGRKKIQDLFVDAKIPRVLRGSIALAAAGNRVLFIPACAETDGKAWYAADCPVKNGSKWILFVECLGGV